MYPRIGVGVLVFKNGQILLGKRVGSHGSGAWNLPGGHLEFSETPEETAARELFEETGIQESQFIRGPWTNDFFEKEGRHYITLWIIACGCNGEPERVEPHKCLEWKFFDLDALPEPLFLPLKHLLQHYQLKDFEPQLQLQ